MEFNTKTIKTIGKAISEELKRCGLGSSDELYNVENTKREFLRQVGQSGLSEFLEVADAESKEEVESSQSKVDISSHSSRPAVIWSVFGKAG